MTSCLCCSIVTVKCFEYCTLKYTNMDTVKQVHRKGVTRKFSIPFTYSIDYLLAS